MEQGSASSPGVQLAASGSPVPRAMSSQQQQQQQQQQHCPPQRAQQQQVKQPCQPPPVKCQETCAPKTKDPCAPQVKKQCPPKGTVIPAQQKCPSAQQAPKSKQK
ncbi:small proline-rich protein 4 [Trachypithecus francoisi]|uniref:small proline-rich protein 4 n=1 Tax=Trachypithecus francoisi TaxID=54180 RepID=UPI00141BA32C|nr:small proline-rich protein 4 [Trachypithecus francoisi]